jgi:hypothetical protein
VNERGVYGSQGWRAGAPPFAIGAVAPEAKRAHTNAVLIGMGVLFGALGWHGYKHHHPLGVISLGASGSLVSSGIAGLLLDREGG